MRTTHDPFDLTGRVALVTGGAGHIGGAIAAALAERGAGIVLLDKHHWDIGPAVASVGVLMAPVDLTVDAEVRAVGDWVVRRRGRLDILVNCAGLTSYPSGLDVPFMEQSLEAWAACMAVNLTAPFALTQACLPMLRESGHGAVVNIGSIYGMVGPDMSLYEGTDMGNAAAYAASKGGLWAFTRWCATALGPDVRFNMVSPGGVFRDQDPAFVDRYAARTPLVRMATEQDVAGAVAFLASDEASYITGQNLAVDGGWVAK